MGCDNLKKLTLGIEWPDPIFCSVNPTSRKDLLGREYLDEVRRVNSLSQLQEIHFFSTQHRLLLFLVKSKNLARTGEVMSKMRKIENLDLSDCKSLTDPGLPLQNFSYPYNSLNFPLLSPYAFYTVFPYFTLQNYPIATYVFFILKKLIYIVWEKMNIDIFGYFEQKLMVRSRGCNSLGWTL